MDRISKEARSYIMARIKAKNTSPEIALRKALWHAGIKGFRIHFKLIGKPDIVFTKRKLAVFVDGDYWHGYLWTKKKKIPPRRYWQTKIKGNMERDKKYNIQLRKDGWKVIRFWEHEVKADMDKVVNKIDRVINK